jgi:hypothetical protein
VEGGTSARLGPRQLPRCLLLLGCDGIVGFCSSVSGPSPVRQARGNLAVASSPPIRSSSVHAMLAAETDKFAQLEAAIKAAKDAVAHKRRIAELAGGAWDAHESGKLKKLRLAAAEAGLASAKQAVAKAAAQEAEMLRELAIERNRASPPQ